MRRKTDRHRGRPGGAIQRGTRIIDVGTDLTGDVVGDLGSLLRSGPLPSRLILDSSHVVRVDKRGLNWLAELESTQSGENMGLVLLAPSPMLVDAMDSFGFGGEIIFASSIGEAIDRTADLDHEL